MNYKFKEFSTKEWNKNSKQLYSRESAIEILREFDANNDDYLHKSQLPQICKSELEVSELLDKWGEIVLKSPFSSSGRGVQMVRNQSLSEYNNPLG